MEENKEPIKKSNYKIRKPRVEENKPRFIKEENKADEFIKMPKHILNKVLKALNLASDAEESPIAKEYYTNLINDIEKLKSEKKPSKVMPFCKHGDKCIYKNTENGCMYKHL